MLPDLARPVVYRSVDLNDAELIGESLIGSHVTRIRMAGIAGTGYVEKKAGSDGMTASDVWQVGRTVEVEGMLYAPSRGDLSDRLQNLVATCTPRSAYAELPGDKGYLPLQFFVPTARLGDVVINGVARTQWPTGEIECFVRARPKAQPQFTVDRDQSGGDDTDALAIPWSATFECIDPRIYIAPRIDTDLDGVAGLRTNTIYNRGSYPAPLNFIFVIPANSGTVTITVVGAGTSMTLVIPDLAFVRTVRLSTIDQIVTSQEGSNDQILAMSFLTAVTNRIWPYVEPLGYAVVNVTPDKTLAEGSLFWYYEALV